MCGIVVNCGPLHRDWPDISKLEPPAYRVPPPECETCGDRGMVCVDGEPVDCPDCEEE